MTATATITSQDVLEAGTVVRCPRYVEGEDTGPRKAVVLGLFREGDPTGGYRVYFYTLGAAGFAEHTVGLAFRREMHPLGTVEDMSERTLVRIWRGLGDFPGSSTARYRVQRMGLRLRNARLGR
ncbi:MULTISPECIES: DUF6409 family protein [Streptomyces]|uniref:Uncharacterized protein n=1 Tax=Streptomyces zinciresistens K42 TaxID=700597 RepID=G2GF05_9ACTN|nr:MULTISPECIES: DUF6409 family protein [Streptomyces]EGX57946.1 hypothetical protein SZN_20442 [Streptomyces zinciresistens K42]MDT9700149.1 DUF6409 family protein [Streptomyces sp. P17]